MGDVSESVFVEEDPSQRCRVYPNEEHQSYRQCDDQFMKGVVSMLEPPIMPVWLTDDADQATSIAVVQNFGKCHKGI